MKKIRINFCDFSSDFSIYDNDFVRILRKRYEVEISNEPDFIFYSCFGFDFLKYNCIRIFYTGECIVPDFNICDYAMGYDYMTNGDRYYRVPLYLLFQYRNTYESVLAKNRDQISTDLFNRQFCSFVVSNDCGQKERKSFFETLSNYKGVSSGGRYLNNIGHCVENKHSFLKQYKFNIAFENCIYPGYTTEKILDAFAAETIPIYYGDPLINSVFNEKAFVNCHEFESFDDVVNTVKEIDQDRDRYDSMLREPILIDNNDHTKDFEDFLFSIFDKDPKEARRRPYNTRVEEREKWNRRIARSEKIVYSKIHKFESFLRRLKRGSL